MSAQAQPQQQDWLAAQVAVIGNVLLKPELTAEMLTLVDASDFNSAYKPVFDAIVQTFRQGRDADLVLVRDVLGPQYTDTLIQIMEVTPHASREHLLHYAEICRNQSRLTKLQGLGASLMASQSLDEATGLIAEANSTVAQRDSSRVMTMEQAMASFLQRHQGEKEYLHWPIEGLDTQLYAEPGDFIVLGGYPSHGKTALSLQFAWAMADDHNVGFFSLETSSAKLFDRQMSSALGIGMERIKRNQLTADDYTRFGTATPQLLNKRLELVQAAGMTVDDIQALSQARKYDVIFIDYLQLISATGSSRYEKVTEISVSLSRMARQYGITVVALSQLSRQDKKSEAEPTLSDLRESGQLEQDADIVFFVYRDGGGEQRILKIAKNKEGTLGHVKLDFDGRTQTFTKHKMSGMEATTEAKKIARAAEKKKKEAAAKQQYYELPDDTPIPFAELTK